MCRRGRFGGQFEKYKFGLGCNGIFIRTGRDLHVSSNQMLKIKITLEILFAMRLSGPILQIIIQLGSHRLWMLSALFFYMRSTKYQNSFEWIVGIAGLKGCPKRVQTVGGEMEICSWRWPIYKQCTRKHIIVVRCCIYKCLRFWRLRRLKAKNAVNETRKMTDLRLSFKRLLKGNRPFKDLLNDL